MLKASGRGTLAVNAMGGILRCYPDPNPNPNLTLALFLTLSASYTTSPFPQRLRGAALRYELRPGEIRAVDNGHLVAWDAAMPYEVST